MSTEVESLSSILSSNSASPATSEPAKAETTDVKAEPAKVPDAAPSAAKPEAETPTNVDAKDRDEKGRFAPKAETKTETKTEAKPEPMVPLAALLAERAKRQNPEPQKPKTSVLENEDTAFAERIGEHVAPLKQAVFEISIEFARQSHDDFDEVASIFAKAADTDERLWAQMRESSNPAKYIYQIGKQFRELAPFGGDVQKYRDHSVATTKAELDKANEQLAAARAELESLKKSKEELESIPRSLNSAASGSQPNAVDADPADLSKIVRFGNH